MRQRGLLAGIILGVFVLAGFAQARESVFSREEPKIERRYGIQLTGGFSTYAMNDLNDFRAGVDHINAGNSEEAQSGGAWGIAAVYRSHKNFRWTIGYSNLGEDQTYSTWINSVDGQTGINQQSVSGSEFYVMGSYMIRFGEALHLHLGAGPMIISGSLDRYSTAANSVYAAKGRALGLRAAGGLEFLFSRNIGLHVAAGYRMANVSEVRYEDTDKNEEVLYNGSSNRTMELDFSGIFLEGGLRLYFDPDTGWFKM